MRMGMGEDQLMYIDKRACNTQGLNRLLAHPINQHL